jgi:hypothetical protein
LNNSEVEVKSSKLIALLQTQHLTLENEAEIKRSG